MTHKDKALSLLVRVFIVLRLFLVLLQKSLV